MSRTNALQNPPDDGAAQTFHQRLRQGIASLDLPTYVYSYPSKRAYRHVAGQIALDDLWRPDDTGAVSLYLHIPFCRYRCTYCTLFLTTRHSDALIDSYVARLCEQIALYGPLAGQRTVSSIYFGGGTPSVMSTAQFDRIFAALDKHFPRRAAGIEICVEGSPDTLTGPLLAHMKALGVNRISTGLQTMHPDELKASGRPYSVEDSIAAIERIRTHFDHCNLDLIYGLSGQTRQSWFDSLEQVIAHQPTTLSLYPVVARPLTALERQIRVRPEQYIDDGAKYSIYDENVARLAAHGYRQESFTRFTRLPVDVSAYAQEAHDFNGTPLIGLGTGARSYCGDYHYSLDYAVNLNQVSKIVDDYIQQPLDRYNVIQYGIRLPPDEARRRFVLLNLTLGRLSPEQYRARFARDVFDDFDCELAALRDEHCTALDDAYDVVLTAKGFKFSSLIAHLLFSDWIRDLEHRYETK